MTLLSQVSKYHKRGIFLITHPFSISAITLLSPAVIPYSTTHYIVLQRITPNCGSCKLSVWLCQIAKHLWYQHLRKHQLAPGSLDDIPEATGPSAEDSLLEQEGRLALELMDAKAPYCGDPTASARIAELLRLPVHFGSYTFSLQTSQRPYGCTLESANPLKPEQHRLINAYNFLSLALVGNLEVPRCTYPAHNGTASEDSLTLEEVNGTLLPRMAAAYNAAYGTDWAPKDSVKDYAKSPADLQRLLLILDSFYSSDLTAIGG